jgi:hypothetical protein
MRSMVSIWKQTQFRTCRSRLTASVARKWVGREDASLVEPASSHENCLPTRPFAARRRSAAHRPDVLREAQVETRRLGEGAIHCDHRPSRRTGAGDPTSLSTLFVRGSGRSLHGASLERSAGGRRALLAHPKGEASAEYTLCQAFLCCASLTARKKALPPPQKILPRNTIPGKNQTKLSLHKRQLINRQYLNQPVSTTNREYTEVLRWEKSTACQ